MSVNFISLPTDTEISYIGSSWDESTPKASGHHSQNYVKVLTTVQDTEALLIAADVETELPNTELQFVVRFSNDFLHIFVFKSNPEDDN